MSFRSIKKGFSLTETIIMLTILAIAVASLTPMVTKKLANNVEAGSTINGISHGRYEAFVKEIVKYGSKAYEKTTKESKNSGGFGSIGTEASIVVFDRLDDLTYKKYTSKNPEMNSKGQKSTLYEQIDNAKAHRSPSGDIEFVEFKKNGLVKKHPVGGNIIVENSDVIYIEGKIIPGNPDSFEKKKMGGITLPNDTNRIIEGVLTKKFNKKSDDNNILWHIDAKNDNADNFEGTVTVIPWEKVISGNKIIVDKPIKKDPTTGEYIGTFDPGIGTKSLVLHTVGGGGAGGGIKSPGKAILACSSDSTSEEREQIRQTLGKRFKEVAAAKGLPEANIPINTLVTFTNRSDFHKLSYKEQFPNDDNYIVINTSNCTITVKVDVRNGLIFPDELLDYTNILGSQTQQSDLYNMPAWGTFNTIYTGGEKGSPFYAASAGQGTAGGAGGTYDISTTSIDISDKKDAYCKLVANIPKIGYCDPCCGTVPAAKIDYSKLEKDFGIKGFASAAKINSDKLALNARDAGAGLVFGDEDEEPACAPCIEEVVYKERFCRWQCGETYYDGYTKTLTGGEGCGACGDCEQSCPGCSVTSATCLHGMHAGDPGPEPARAVACTKVSKPINMMKECVGNATNSTVNGSNPAVVNYEGMVNIEEGTPGRSCFMVAGGFAAASLGGGVGQTCPKVETRVHVDVSDELAKDGTDLEGMISSMEYLLYHNLVKLNKAIGKYELSSGFNCNKKAIKFRPDAYGKIGSNLSFCNVMDFMNANNDAWKVAEARLDIGYDETLKALDTSGEHLDKMEAMINEKNKIAKIASKTQIWHNNYTADIVMVRKAIKCNTSVKCGKDGSPGVAKSNCADETGVCEEGLSNHIYSWTIPFALNQLHYGEAGKPGEYKTTKIAKTTGPISVKLGIGGAWADLDNVNGQWTQGKKGPDGTDTTIKMEGRNILTAKGGKGGSQSLSTHRYDLCYAKKDECKRTDASVTCCDNEIGKRSTKEIFTTANRMSAFENIKGLTGNSTIVGIGLGRGGEGAGTRAGVEQLEGVRVFRNSSGCGLSYEDSQIVKQTGTENADKTAAAAGKFQNKALAPSTLNSKGGDGGVIITW